MSQQQIKLYTPSKPQLWANELVHVKKPFITCMNYGRQTGKSYWAINDAITRGINNSRQRIRFVVPSYSLGVKHMQTIDNMFSGHEDIKNQIFKKSKLSFPKIEKWVFRVKILLHHALTYK